MTDADDGLSREQQVSHYVDLYKQSVEVQMHFNDVEWRIRGLALTVATFALGAAGVAAKDGTTIGGVALGSLVIVIGLEPPRQVRRLTGVRAQRSAGPGVERSSGSRLPRVGCRRSTHRGGGG